MALRLFRSREGEIESFALRPYWTVEADAATGSRGVLTARLSRLDGAPLTRCTRNAGDGGYTRPRRQIVDAIVRATRKPVRVGGRKMRPEGGGPGRGAADKTQMS